MSKKTDPKPAMPEAGEAHEQQLPPPPAPVPELPGGQEVIHVRDGFDPRTGEQGPVGQLGAAYEIVPDGEGGFHRRLVRTGASAARLVAGDRTGDEVQHTIAAHPPAGRTLLGELPELPPDARGAGVPAPPPGAEGASHENHPVPRPRSGPVASIGLPSPAPGSVAGTFMQQVPGLGGPGGVPIPPPRPMVPVPQPPHAGIRPGVLGPPPAFRPPPGSPHSPQFPNLPQPSPGSQLLPGQPHPDPRAPQQPDPRFPQPPVPPARRHGEV